MTSFSQSIKLTRFQGGGRSIVEDFVAEEEPLQITIDGVPIAVVMRTGGDDEDLVLGFLRTEGIVSQYSAIKRVDLKQKKNHAYVFLEDDVEVDHQRLKRNLYSASSCGVCGKASIDSICQTLPPIKSFKPFCVELILKGPEMLGSAQKVFESTGGLHAAALVHRSEEIVMLKEDVGRHNAIDKVLGWAWKENVCLEDVFLQVSGRVSFEVMQKALAGGISTVSAISAPTSLAIEFAKESGQTLLGFVREDRLNLYAGEVSHCESILEG